MRPMSKKDSKEPATRPTTTIEDHWKNSALILRLLASSLANNKTYLLPKI